MQDEADQTGVGEDRGLEGGRENAVDVTGSEMCDYEKVANITNS